MMLTQIRMDYINSARSEVLAVIFTHFWSSVKGSSKHLLSSHATYFQKGTRAIIMGTSFFTGMNQLNKQDLFWYTLSDLLYRFWFARTKCHGNTVKHSYLPQPKTRTIVSFLLLPSERPKNSPSVQASRLCFLLWFVRVEHVSPCNAAG